MQCQSTQSAAHSGEGQPPHHDNETGCKNQEAQADASAAASFLHGPLPMRTANAKPTAQPADKSEPLLKTEEKPCADNAIDSDSEDVLSPTEISEVQCTLRSLCLAASARFLEDRHINRIIRGGVSSAGGGPQRTKPRRFSQRHAPYPKQARAGRDRQRPNYELGTEEEPSGALLDNISTINTQIWEQAQRDRLHVPLTERTAVQNMARLIEWGELVVMGPSGVDLEDDNGHSPQMLYPMLAAGKNLCRYLGYDEGVVWIREMTGMW